MPLGNKLWEQSSRALHRKIMDVSEKGIHAEVSFAGEMTGFGRLHGRTARYVGTDDYWENLTGDIITGTASGVLTFQDGDNEIVPFKVLGLGKLIKQSPMGIEKLLSLIYFVNPPPNLSWMRSTLVIWEAITDPKTQTLQATAYEWT